MKKRVFVAAVAFFTTLFLLSGFLIWRHFAGEKENEDGFKHLAAQIVLPPPPVLSEPTSPTSPGEAQPLGTPTWTTSDQYGALFKQYPDMVGWISIEGTLLNYPVMQTPDSPDYYLRRGLDRRPSDYGVPYAAEGCSIGPASDNITIYGHHMKSGRLFGALDAYTDEAFWQEHPVVQFDTRAGFGTYEVFAVFIVNPDNFAYHTFVSAADAAGFDAYVRRCTGLSLYDTGITARYGDKLITLSTCEYSMENGRLVVVARKIQD